MWTGGFKQIAVNVCQTNPAIDFDEVKAVAELAGLELEDFCRLQMAYEVAAHCSSMVVDMEDGDVIDVMVEQQGGAALPQ